MKLWLLHSEPLLHTHISPLSAGLPGSPGGGGRASGSSAQDVFLFWGHRERKVAEQGPGVLGHSCPHPLRAFLREVPAGAGTPTGRWRRRGVGGRSKPGLVPASLSCRAGSEMIRPGQPLTAPTHPAFLTELSPSPTLPPHKSSRPPGQEVCECPPGTRDGAEIGPAPEANGFMEGRGPGPERDGREVSKSFLVQTPWTPPPALLGDWRAGRPSLGSSPSTPTLQQACPHT